MTDDSFFYRELLPMIAAQKMSAGLGKMKVDAEAVPKVEFSLHQLALGGGR
jgi:hypothetical protein